ncbi:MAG: SCP2 sterol-binding domain-containing protein [Candidatus Thermoplasmatota archaeon]|jgi:putative sterol carrier protein|nr:SCP2 sterol-binding domain-containing protein [Candidatus Thermoplasmatota archaeon]
MYKFPSEEWAKAYYEKLNENKAYEESARDWEGGITMIIQSDEKFSGNAYLYLDLFHGKCRSYKLSSSENEIPKAEFTYSGKFTSWKNLINGEIDPIKGILTGKFKLKGSMAKIMKYTKAAKLMVSTASQVPSEF